MSKEKDCIELDGSGMPRKSGRAVFDKSGRGSWEWQVATGVFESDVNHEQLRHLEATHLAIVDAHAGPAEGRVWECPVERSRSGSETEHNSGRRRTQRVAQTREYENVLSRLLRRLAR